MAVMELVGEPDNRCLSLAELLRTMLTKYADAGSLIDIHPSESSTGLWLRVDGVEFHILVKPSAKQRVRDGGTSF